MNVLKIGYVEPKYRRGVVPDNLYIEVDRELHDFSNEKILFLLATYNRAADHSLLLSPSEGSYYLKNQYSLGTGLQLFSNRRFQFQTNVEMFYANYVENISDPGSGIDYNQKWNQKGVNFSIGVSSFFYERLGLSLITGIAYGYEDDLYSKIYNRIGTSETLYHHQQFKFLVPRLVSLSLIFNLNKL